MKSIDLVYSYTLDVGFPTMLRRFGQPSSLLIALLVCFLLCLPTPGWAQGGAGGGGAGGGGGGAGGGGAGGGGNNNGGGGGASGVRIDATGTLRLMRANPVVTMARLRAAKQTLPQHLARPSKLRKVSLNRLEAAVAEKLAKGETPSPEMITLAGMTRLEYVFFYPESGDIVLAGPAEGFGQDSTGRIVGVETGKPTLLLEDLIVALRAYGPKNNDTDYIGVSIDPTQEGLAKMQKTLRNLGSSIQGAGGVQTIVNSLRTSLGPNTVTIDGVPAGTHFAHILTEADYRMKLIGIGLEQPPIPMRSYVARLTSSMASSNALVRWFFVPDYSAIATSEDGLSMKMVGQGVKLVGEDEVVSGDGSRKVSGRPANLASRGFTTEFTKKFRAISENSRVFSQLRNLVDLTIAAAFIQDRDLYGKSGFDLGVLGSEDKLPVQVLPAPKKVETAINAVMKGSRLITPIGGGVTIEAAKALKKENLQSDSSIQRVQESVGLDSIPAAQWWWD
ncbi:MAG: DUF1598 domain-containing protein [Planctomycetota bacterium]|nr:DUF1598 domain-containing protein [Planctomycetota bacterium]